MQFACLIQFRFKKCIFSDENANLCSDLKSLRSNSQKVGSVAENIHYYYTFLIILCQNSISNKNTFKNKTVTSSLYRKPIFPIY